MFYRFSIYYYSGNRNDTIDPIDKRFIKLPIDLSRRLIYRRFARDFRHNNTLKCVQYNIYIYICVYEVRTYIDDVYY